MNHHPHLKEPFPFPHRVDHCVSAVQPVAAAVRGTLKAVGVLEHHYILCQNNAYLVAVAVVATLAAAILDSHNYQESSLHSLAGVAPLGTLVADSHGCPVGYLGIQQRRIGAG